MVDGPEEGIDLTPYSERIDLLAGGFPCQAFSYAGKKRGFEDTRGTLFFELARAIREMEPKVVLCENVRGLFSHDHGRTYATIAATIGELGYTIVGSRALNALLYKVPQRRQRLFIVAVRNDLVSRAEFHWPSPYYRVMTLREAFFAGELYPVDVPASAGSKYPQKKAAVLLVVPQGGNWKDLPPELQQAYLGGSYNLPGGKTGIAPRLALDEPSLTLTCARAQKQTERCHPTETRPLTVREYARI